MEKLLVMVPTRGRPKICKEMWDSYQATKSEGTDILLYLNEDDEKLGEYLKIFKSNYVIGPRKYLAAAYNFLFEKYGENFKWFAPCNDDHIFFTPQWDIKLISIINELGRDWGLAAAEDRLTNWAEYQHPSGCVVSGSIPRTLGYFIWPAIRHIGIDCYFMRLMRGIDRLYHSKDIVIEHRHWLNGKRPLDANYKWVYNQEQYNYGMVMVQEYINNHLEKDIVKIQDAMRKERDAKV